MPIIWKDEEADIFDVVELLVNAQTQEEAKEIFSLYRQTNVQYGRACVNYILLDYAEDDQKRVYEWLDNG